LAQQQVKQYSASNIT